MRDYLNDIESIPRLIKTESEAFGELSEASRPLVDDIANIAAVCRLAQDLTDEWEEYKRRQVLVAVLVLVFAPRSLVAAERLPSRLRLGIAENTAIYPSCVSRILQQVQLLYARHRLFRTSVNGVVSTLQDRLTETNIKTNE